MGMEKQKCSAWNYKPGQHPNEIGKTLGLLGSVCFAGDDLSDFANVDWVVLATTRDKFPFLPGERGIFIIYKWEIRSIKKYKNGSGQLLYK